MLEREGGRHLSDAKLSWRRYCGFFELSIKDFMTIQESLLREELDLVGASPLGKRLFGGTIPTVQDFRTTLPLTTYKDYQPFLSSKREDILPEKPVCWAFTTTTAGAEKWTPFTARAFNRLIDYTIAALILATARHKGDINIGAGERVMYNVAPAPFLSGLMAHGLAERCNLTGIPPSLHDSLGFQGALEEGFKYSLVHGCDVVISMTPVMLKIGQRLSAMSTSHASGLRKTRDIRVLFRIALARIKSIIEHRPILPKDLWNLKGVIGWGIDTSLLRDKIRYYWGREPYEFMACSEVGILAMQSWSKRAMTFVPAAAYLEFIPEEELAKERDTQGYNPRTVLLNELEPGKRYEVVATSFYGMPLIRYRLGMLVRVVAMEDPRDGIQLPQVELVGRTGGLIDLAGFTRLDEKTIWSALVQSGLEHGNWTVRKEMAGEDPSLTLYIELEPNTDVAELQERVHSALKSLDPSYRDLESLLSIKALRIVRLNPGTFRAYTNLITENGLMRGLAYQVPKVDASQEVVDKLLELSGGFVRQQKVESLPPR